MTITNIINDLSIILVPRVCFGCNAQLIDREHCLCTFCRNDLPLTQYNFLVENPIDRIFFGRMNIEKVNSFMFFTENGTVQTLIHYLKYKNQEVIGTLIGEWFGQTIIKNGYLKDIDFVIPVPLHPKKQKKRGYNQVAKFAICLAKYLKATYADDILIKTSNSKTQTKKGRLSRWYDNKSLFEVKNVAQLKGKNVLLVDDIITTGATIVLCGTALKRETTLNLYVASMAAVPLE